MSNGPSTPLSRLNAFVDRGWLAILSDVEKSLWMAYARFSDVDGFAFPGNDKLAQLMNHRTDRHIQRAKASLRAHGLIEAVNAKGGRSQAATVRVLMPPFQPANDTTIVTPERVASDATLCAEECPERVAESATLFSSESGERVAESDTKGWRNRALKGGVIEQAHKDEQTIEQTKNRYCATAAPLRAGKKKSTTDKNAGALREPSKRGATRKLSDEQQQTRVAFTRWYVEVAFPHINAGVKYEFDAEGSRNGKAVMTVLGSEFVGWDLLRAKQVTREFLQCGDAWIRSRGFKLHDLAERVARFGADVVRRERGQPLPVENKPGNAARSRMAARSAELDEMIEKAMKDEVTA